MKKSFILLVLLFISSVSFSQDWERTFGDTLQESGNAVIQTVSGNFVATGLTTSIGAGGSDIYLVKVNSQGDSIFARTYGGPGNDEGYSVIETFDNGYAIVGETKGFSGGTLDNQYLIKTDSNGITQWTKQYEIGTLSDVVETADSGLCMAGWGTVGFVVIRSDKNGDTLWTKEYGDGMQAFSICLTADGGYAVTGKRNGITGNDGLFLSKLNSNGDSLWTKTFAYQAGTDIELLNNGGFIISGYQSAQGPGNAVMIKTDSNGDGVWAKTHGGGGLEMGNSCKPTLDGGYLLAGLTTSFGAGHHDIWVVKTDGNGDTLWTRTCGDAGDDRGYSVFANSDGGFIVCGRSTVGVGDLDLYLKRVYGPPASVSELPLSDVAVYPNPTNGRLSIASKEILDKWEIMDQFGRVVANGKGTQRKFSINLDGNLKGIYFLVLSLGHYQEVRKVVFY